MPTYTGTPGNDSWTVVNPGTFTLDGLGGTDTLFLGTSLRSSYSITQSADGAVHVDSITSASAPLHATLYNMEVLVFNSGKDTLNLSTLFAAPPPTVSISDNTPGTAIGNVTYSLAFSESVTGLTTSDFTVTNGSVVSVSGSGANYSVIVAPSANTEGTMGLTLKAASVTDAAGLSNKTDTIAAAQIIDTKPPTLGTVSPTDHSTGVAVGSNIVISFSEPIQKGSGNIVLHDGTGATVATYDVATSSNLSVSGATLTIHPSTTLAYNTGYTLQLSGGNVQDLAGNSFVGTASFGFSTQADPNSSAITNIISGTPGNDVLVGNALADTFNPGTGADLIKGGSGSDTVNLVGSGKWAAGFAAVNEGAPGLAGTGQQIVLDGKNRLADVVVGGSGSNTLILSDGNDAFLLHDAYSLFNPSVQLTADGHQTLSAPRVTNIQVIQCVSGNNIVDLTSASYQIAGITIKGGTGNDILWGNAGDDYILAGSGNDILFGGAGNNILVGGPGSDTFQFVKNGGGNTTIQNFLPGKDFIQLFGAANVSEVAIALSTDHVTLTWGNQTIILAGITSTAGSANWFHLA